MPSTNGHGPKPERVALYLRVSSEEQRDRETIEIQRDFLEQYRTLYELEVTDVYEDNGISGTIPLHERPEGKRLLEDAREGKFGAVLVSKLDRLGRTLLVIVDAHDKLQEAGGGVALISGREPIDTSNPSGRLIFQMLASFAEYDRENIAERTQAGQRRAFFRGRQVGAIPYGYDIVEKDGAFVVVEEEAAIVREIIANVAADATLYSEAKRLNDEGIPSPGNRYRGKPRKHGSGWGHTTIREIIQQRAYAGTHVVKLGGGAEIIERPVPTIVDPALREKALERLKENKRYAGGRRKRNYLLSGIIECVNCGWTYVGNATSHAKGAKRYYQYRCGTRVRVQTHATAATRARKSTRSGWRTSCGTTCGDSFRTLAKSWSACASSSKAESGPRRCSSASPLFRSASPPSTQSENALCASTRAGWPPKRRPRCCWPISRTKRITCVFLSLPRRATFPRQRRTDSWPETPKPGCSPCVRTSPK
jgi:DNA invertase Pin-like site-specific DNA recombinase